MQVRLPEDPPEASKPADLKFLYQEGCASLRHYSTCVLNTRTITIAQGFALLTASTYLVSQERYALSLSVSAFGLLFTVILHSLLSSYGRVFEVMLPAVIQLESKSSEPEIKGPWQAYNADLQKLKNQWTWRILVRGGPVILLVFSFAITAGYCLLVLL